MRVIALDPDYDHPDPVRRVQFHPDGGRLAAVVGVAKFATTVSVWDLHTDREAEKEFTPAGAADLEEYADPAVAADLSVLACHGHEDASGTDTVEVRRVGEPHRTWQVGEDDEAFAVHGLAFTPDGSGLLAGVTRADGPQVARWDVPGLFAGGRQAATMAEDDPLPLDRHRPTCLACSPDGRRLAVGTAAEAVEVFGLPTGEPLRVFRRKAVGKRPKPVRGLAWSPDGRLLLVRAAGLVTVWDAVAGRPVAELTGPAKLADAAFSPDGRLVAGCGWDGAVTVWDAGSFAVRQRYDWRQGRLHAVAFAPDGLTCAAGADRGRVVVWDVEG